MMDLLEKITTVEQEAARHFTSLGSEQLNWKPAPEKWSIAQCLQHLVISNKSFFPAFDKILQNNYRLGFFQKLNPFKKMMGKYMVKSLGPQVKKKFKAPAIYRPSSSEVNPDIVTRFLSQQSEIKNYLNRLAAQPVEKIYMASPVTPMIIYSVESAMQIIAVHQQRHLNQALQILQHPNFPR